MVSESYFDWTDQLFNTGKVFEKPEALKGVRVLDLSVIILGPATADYLAEWGAEVIKVEMPGMGDVMRIVAPEGYYWQSVSPAFFAQNHNKYHVAVDLHKPEGQELIRKLAAKSDILVENYKPGTLERKWGLGYRQLKDLNPRLIYVANTGFGQWGPFSKRPSYDALAQAMSGLSMISGFDGRPPLKIGIFIGDYFGACLSALAALSALRFRERTGKGQFVEVAQCEALIRAMDWTWAYVGLTGQNRRRVGNQDAAISPSGIFRCQDGFVAVEAGTDEGFQRLCRAMGRPGLMDDSRFSRVSDRLRAENAEALERIIADWTAGKTTEEIDQLGEEYGFAAAPVSTAEAHYHDSHFRSRGSIWELDDPIYGQMVEYGPAPKLSETPARFKWAGPPVGIHNEYVFTRLLGLSLQELKELEAKAVIGRWADRTGAKPPEGWRGEGTIL
ncbi:MAG: CaiB/BaiF CoA transferase family protein [Candidatus Methylomirabilales bacterium]